MLYLALIFELTLQKYRLILPPLGNKIVTRKCQLSFGIISRRREIKANVVFDIIDIIRQILITAI